MTVAEVRYSYADTCFSDERPAFPAQMATNPIPCRYLSFGKDDPVNTFHCFKVAKNGRFPAEILQLETLC